MPPPPRRSRGRRPLLAACCSVFSVAGELPPFSPALRDELWKKAQAMVDALPADSYEHNEKRVCAAGNWGDGPQCDQWDQGHSPCWPSTMTISASWDTDLMARWSREMAQEFGLPNRGQLGPGINIARFAWNGRLGEYMSGEDPYLGARMTSAMVTAYRSVPGSPPLQTAKHFIANTIENDRMGMTEVIDERTLFEVHYPPFQAAVDAGVSAVMCSYNLVKCTSGLCSAGAAYACANDDILNKHLKQVMGFRGMVVSDWDATKCQQEAVGSGGCPAADQYVDREYAAESGLDLEMPSCNSFKGGVKARAKEKAARANWAYMVQGRELDKVKTGENKGWFAPGHGRRLTAGFCCWWPQPPAKDICASCQNKDSNPTRGTCTGTGTWCGGTTAAPADAASSAPQQPEPVAADDPAAPKPQPAAAIDPAPQKAQQPDPVAADDPAAPKPQPAAAIDPAPQKAQPAAGSSPEPSVQWPPRPNQAPSAQELCDDAGGENYKSPCKLELADRIIAESAVVLKNAGAVLPLSKDATVALVGKEACSKKPLAIGGGSGWNGYACNDVPKLSVKDGIAGVIGYRMVSCPDGGDDGSNSKAGSADVVIVVVAIWSSEGQDRSTLQIGEDEVKLIRDYGKQGKKVVVVINTPGPVITSPWDDAVAGLVMTWLPGQQNGRGIAMALYNEGYETSGRLPFTFPKCNTAKCTIADERASVHLGDQIDSKAYRTFTEKALVGYRWYHAERRAVSFPFGFGLFAYGSAEVQYSGAKATATDAGVQVSCQLKHSGPRAGRDVPQLYLSFPASVPGDKNSKPEWVLKGFEKVTVKPRVAATASFELLPRDFSYWDDAPGQSRWVCAQGTFRACVGANARDAVSGDNRACTSFSLGAGCKMGQAYDCEAGYANWAAGWSSSKKKWCCENEEKGCEPQKPKPLKPVPPVAINAKPAPPPAKASHEPDSACDLPCKGTKSETCKDFHHSAVDLHLTTKKHSCVLAFILMRHDCPNCHSCPLAGVGCEVAKPPSSTPAPADVKFDCFAGYTNFELGWSEAKKAWCCQEDGRGCPQVQGAPQPPGSAPAPTPQPYTWDKVYQIGRQNGWLPRDAPEQHA